MSDSVRTEVKGADWQIDVQLLTSNCEDSEVYTPYDLTGASAITAEFPGQSATKISVTLAGSEIVVNDAKLAKLSLNVPSTKSDDIKEGARQSFQVKTVVGSEEKTWLFEKLLTVKADLFA